MRDWSHDGPAGPGVTAGRSAPPPPRIAAAVRHAGPHTLGRLLDAVVAIGVDLDLDAMLQRLVEAAVDLVDARFGALGLLDESGAGLLELVTVGVDDDPAVAIGHLSGDLGRLAALVADGAPVRLADPGEHPGCAGFPPGPPPLTSFLGVPVTVRGEAFGVLCLADKTTGEVFTDVDQELAAGLAAAAGSAIDNARLRVEDHRRAAAMAAMTEVADRLLAGADGHSCLALVARHARRVLRADLVVITVPGDDWIVVDGADARAGGEAAGGFRGDQRKANALNPLSVVPVVAGGRRIGALTIVRTAPGAALTASETSLARAFAAQAALVVKAGDRRSPSARPGRPPRPARHRRPTS